MGQNGLTGNISLACSGAPAGAICGFSPPSVTLTGTQPVNVTVTVNTTSRGSVPPGGNPFRPRPLGAPAGWLWIVVLALFTSTVAYWKARQLGWARMRLATVLAGLLMAAVTTWAACGAGGGPTPMSSGTPPGTYNLTVSATYNVSGTDLALVHNATLQLTVH